MSCNTVCRECPRKVYSQAVTFANDTLTINIPAGSYQRGCKYCLVVTQNIPAATTITAPVVITIGDGTEEYPLVGCNCAQLTACSIRTRTRYPVFVATTPTGGSFRLMGRAACAPNYNLSAIDGTVPAAAAAEGGNA